MKLLRNLNASVRRITAKLGRLNAWLGRNPQARERRKLHRERRQLFGRLIKLAELRAKFPEHQDRFLAEARSINARLDAIALADDIAGIEARIEPVAPWPGLPTEGLRVVQGGKQ